MASLPPLNAGEATKMSGVSTYLNFQGTTEAAFEFYRPVFGARSDGANEVTRLQDMFWGSNFGTEVDCFGTRRMFNCSEPES